MKILYLTHALPRFAGDLVTVFIRSLALAFKEKGHDIVVMAPWHPKLDLPYERSLFAFEPYHYFPIRQWEVMGYSYGMSNGLRLNRRNYFLGPFLILAGISACSRLAWRMKPDFIFANWGVPNGFFGAIASRLFHIPLVVAFPGADVKIITSGVLCRLVGRFVGSTARVLATNSSELRDALVAIGLPARKFHYVIYGASRAEFAPDAECRELKRQELGISHDTLVVGAIGRFVNKKGFEYLVDSARFVTEAIAHTRRVVFMLFGAGDNEGFLRQRIEQQGLTDRFLLPGPAPPESLRSLYNAFDIFVNPAVQKPIDGLNVVVVEAMACGKPVVATNVCGNDLVVRHGENGILVPQQNSRLLADAILTLVNDPSLRERMGAASRRSFEAEFTWERIVERYIALVSESA